uniref:BZIP domain-containing protein n=1 Tax=Culex tarsalis TaxID=7177 RepID=A0A1Q3EV55_CULTA
MISKGIVTSKDRVKKRKFLHNVIRRLLAVPEIPQAQQYDQQPPCLEQQIKAEPETCEEDELLYPVMSLTEDGFSDDTNSRADSEDLQSTSLNLSKSSTSSHKRRLDRIPDRMSQVSEAGRSELVIPCTYNSRMARAYPKEQVESRSPAERERREKNTLAARHSRAKMRALDELLHKESETAKEENARLKVAIAASFSYAGLLMERLGMPTAGMNFMDVWDSAWQVEMGRAVREEVKEEPQNKGLSADKSKIEDDEIEE